MLEQYFVKDKEKLQQIEDALRATYFTNYDANFLDTEAGREDIKANVFKRYESALQHVVPWVANHIDLQGKTLVEVGCGNGASTAAFAHFVKEINGYDIDAQAVDGARARMEVMGFNNVVFHLVTAKDLVARLKENHANHAEGVDIILFFAVLEHQTIRERHETIRLCWELLNPGGLLVVADTPNLLYFTDLHTSLLPFLHLLPTELYARYANRSPREGFNNGFADFDTMSLEELDTSIMRWGRGVSYHDFELALGTDYGSYLVANGFEKEMLDWVGVSFEEELLRHYFLVKKLDVPLAFSRVVLNLIYKKDKGIIQQSENIPENVFIADMSTVRELETTVNRLRIDLAATEKYLHDILSSKRWLMGNILAAPYRKLKSIFARS
ncbi:MAG TPA: class I SAM-dependent methyltransferase [Gammaproteobacteria bacterium]|nr:class I SAM-dependent methyltransferase [Gammaproteobacteria bacterium]